AEAARVAEAEHRAVVEHDVDMVVRARLRRRPVRARARGAHEAAGHAEMDDQRVATVLEAADDVLRAPLDRRDGPAREPLGEALGQRCPQIRAALHDMRDAAPDPERAQAAHHGLDLGKLRHDQALAPARLLSERARGATRREWAIVPAAIANW